MGRSAEVESDLQVQVVDYLKVLGLRCSILFFSVPNEALGKVKSRAGLWRMARLKRMGLRPGASDLVLVYRGRVLFIELKTPTGNQSVHQMEFEAESKLVGAKYFVARTFDEAQKIILDFIDLC